ncbi:hypothetical protein FB470_000226 [Amycolatopsis thermophila]|uniref:Uncharacterized protein n=1 Tax=Amycolatopsis thermophila TaxID=206084 RepID=A0ABU0ELX6_9PSEU|nr:hypothetical protein [Amycolatopsis thermophila]
MTRVGGGVPGLADEEEVLAEARARPMPSPAP